MTSLRFTREKIGTNVVTRVHKRRGSHSEQLSEWRGGICGDFFSFVCNGGKAVVLNREDAREISRLFLV